jgi:isoaspartyl peptidase/L-asparaginase-like protein (Ntn-hydrolase superfamily)
VVELDCPDMTVGLGSRPDRDGFVTLDAAIMTDDGRAGCVAFVQGVAHPISLARLVMEKTPHVLLVGAGAEQFARECGIEVAPPALTPEAERQWRAWLVERRYEPKVNIENHDTISMLALDAQGRMAAASTTSGLAYKMHGRVGDSPIIGAGVFVDAPIGGAICTGLGETVLRTLGANLAVEAMRAGASPQQACEHAIERIIAKNGDPKLYQVGMLALDYEGRVGAYAVQPGFNYARGSTLVDAASKLG